MTRFKAISVLLAAALLAAASGLAQAGSTLAAVHKKGFLQCGISDGLRGFSYADAKGNYLGLDVDLCRAVAAAVFGDASKVRFTALTSAERFTALQSGSIEVLARNSSWTSSRELAMGIRFAGVNYYDGQGFLLHRKHGVSSAKDLDGASVCVQAATTSELNLADYFRSTGLQYTAVRLDSTEQSVRALESGRCEVLSSDQSQLYALRSKLSVPGDYVVLPEVISKEPLGPAVRQGDDQWLSIVRWTLFAMLIGEELGIDSHNALSLGKTSQNPEIARLLGAEGELGQQLGLPRDWAVQIIRQVGNYAEVFSRNVGTASELKIDRGLNALWNKGGLQYAPPVR